MSPTPFLHLSKDLPCAGQLNPKETPFVIDGNSVFYSIKDVPKNFKMFCSKGFDITGKHGVSSRTNSYLPNSVKSLVRQQRGVARNLPQKDKTMRRPKEWEEFQQIMKTRKSLIQLLLKMWSTD